MFMHLFLMTRRSTVSVRNALRVRPRRNGCRAIDGHVESGHSASPQFRRLTRRWHGTFYRCDPARPFQLSAERLGKIYYSRWLRSGRQVEALHHRHGANHARFTLSPAQRRRVQAALRVVDCFRELHRLVFAGCRRVPCREVLIRSFTTDERRHLVKIFFARRAGRVAERRFAAWCHEAARTFAVGGVR